MSEWFVNTVNTMGSSQSTETPYRKHPADYALSIARIHTAFKQKYDAQLYQFRYLIEDLVGKFGYDVVDWHGDDDYIEVRNKQTNEVFDFGLRELIQLARYKQAIDQLEKDGFNLIRFYDESYTLRILKAFAELPDSDPTRVIILSKLNSVLDRKHMLVSMSGENAEGPIFVDVLGKKHTSREVVRLIQFAMLNQGYRFAERKDDVRKEFDQLYEQLQKIYPQSPPPESLATAEDYELQRRDEHLLAQFTRDVLSKLHQFDTEKDSTPSTTARLKEVLPEEKAPSTTAGLKKVPPASRGQRDIELADRGGLDRLRARIDTAVDIVVGLVQEHGRSATRNPAALKTVIISLLIQGKDDLSNRIASSPEALRYLNEQLIRKGLDLRIVPEDIPATTSV